MLITGTGTRTASAREMFATSDARATRAARDLRALAETQAASAVAAFAVDGGADVVVRGGRRMGLVADRPAPGQDARTSDIVAVRSGGRRRNPDIVHELKTREQFDKMFQKGPTVTAGAPTELKFLINRQSGEIYFLPPKYPFHFEFYKNVLRGPMEGAEFNEKAYNRPDREWIAGTVTAYDSYVDPASGKKGQLCFSLWPTDRFDAGLLKETHDAVKKGLKFAGADDSIAFRPGGPIQDKLLQQEKPKLDAAGIAVKTNVEISKGLTSMTLSDAKAIGRLVIVEPGEAMPVLTRKDAVLFLGDVPAEAPPVAAIFTTTVQTYNSHLGIKYRQDDTPYFYKSFTPEEIAELKALEGKFVEVDTTNKDPKVTEATQAQAEEFLDKIKPKGRVRLTPNLNENKARTFDDMARLTVGADGTWNRDFLGAYGRKTAGLIELEKLKQSGALDVGGPSAPQITTPQQPIGIPANWYTRFIQSAVDDDGVTFSERIKRMTSDPRFKSDDAWKARALDRLRDDIEDAQIPPDLLKDVKEQVAKPYLKMHPNLGRARMRSSSPVVEDGGNGSKLPNMAGAFDSHTARWEKGRTAAETLDNAARAMAETLLEDYSSVWNDRAIAELEWHNVDLDEKSVTMSIVVAPNEDDELANAVVRVNRDLAGFFSITGEAQHGENLVTNPEGGQTPDTWIDGNYDVLNGVAKQSIAYERESNLVSSDPERKHAFKDEEIMVVYEGMRVVRDHFAALEGVPPEQYINECEIKITAEGQVQFKQERPWRE